MKYRKKPVEIEAIVWDGYNFEEIQQFAGPAVSLETYVKFPDLPPVLIIETLESNAEANTRHAATIGDYIIKGVKGEFYFCKPDIFQLSYDPVVDADPESGLYCIEVERELEEQYTFHHTFLHKPNRDQVLALIIDEDLNYDDDHGKFIFYRVG